MSEARENMEKQVIAAVLRNGYTQLQANFMIALGLSVKGEWVDSENPTVKFEIIHKKQPVTMFYSFENSCNFSNRPYDPGAGLPRQTDMTCREVLLTLQKVIFPDGTEEQYEEAIWSQRTIEINTRAKALEDFANGEVDYLLHLCNEYWGDLNTKGFDPKYGVVGAAVKHLSKLIRSRGYADKREDNFDQVLTTLFGEDAEAFRPVLEKLRMEIPIICRVNDAMTLIAAAHYATKGK